jgi:hypothetical protein
MDTDRDIFVRLGNSCRMVWPERSDGPHLEEAAVGHGRRKGVSWTADYLQHVLCCN